MTTDKQITLFSKENGSDKIYNIFMDIDETSTSYSVNFSYGRRGTQCTN